MNKFIATLLLIAFHSPAHALIQETPTLDDCLAIAAKDSAQLAPNEVIYAFDIDNTVLKLNQNLGSVQWFRWQQRLIKDGILKDRVAETVDELLDKQGLLYFISRSQTPEKTIAEKILKLQKNGHKVLYHTSRSANTRGPTERELIQNSLLPLENTIGPTNGYAGEFTFENGPTTQRAVTFQNGVYMSAGQNKGMWLTLLLQKVDEEPKHIVFVDDELKNLENVEHAFQSKIPTTLCRYGKVDGEVHEFNQSSKQKEIELWNELSKTVEKFN